MKTNIEGNTISKTHKKMAENSVNNLLVKIKANF